MHTTLSYAHHGIQGALLAVMAWGNNENQHTSYGKEEAMTQAPENDKKAPKDRDDHHDDANPMPDTHHVNPDSDDDSSDKKKSKDKH